VGLSLEGCVEERKLLGVNCSGEFLASIMACGEGATLAAAVGGLVGSAETGKVPGAAF
jgi:hypothetical protein